MEGLILCISSFDSCTTAMCMLHLFMRSASSFIFVLMPSMFSCSKFMLLVVVVCVLLAIWLVSCVVRVELIVVGVVVYSCCWEIGGGFSLVCTPGTCTNVSVMFSIG